MQESDILYAGKRSSLCRKAIISMQESDICVQVSDMYTQISDTCTHVSDVCVQSFARSLCGYSIIIATCINLVHLL